MKRIIIADDHAIVRKGLRQLIQETYPFCEVTEVGTAEELIAWVLREDWDAAVTDVSMPGRTGIEALEQIKAAKPLLPVLVLSIHAEEQYALRAIKAGASGYLNKDSAPEELVKALEVILAGRRYISSNIADLMARSLYDKPEGGKDALSDRELQVLTLIGKGRSNKEIGIQLSIGISTVSTYRSRIMEKLSLKTNSELIRFCMDEGLI